MAGAVRGTLPRDQSYSGGICRPVARERWLAAFMAATERRSAYEEGRLATFRGPADDAAAAIILQDLRSCAAHLRPEDLEETNSRSDRGGVKRVGEFINIASRNQGEPWRRHTLFKLGCGTGMTTRIFSQLFEQVQACSHLSAQTVASSANDSALTGDFEAPNFGVHERFVFWCSHSLLFWTPPDLTGCVLARALSLLGPGDVAVFVTLVDGADHAMPGFLPYYPSSSLQSYVLQQDAVYKTAYAANCLPLETNPRFRAVTDLMSRWRVFTIKK